MILESHSLVFRQIEANDRELEIYFSEKENIFYQIPGNRFVYKISVIRDVCQLVKKLSAFYSENLQKKNKYCYQTKI